MALILESWEVDGNDEVRVYCLRSDSKDFWCRLDAWLTQQKEKAHVVRITKSNTSNKQSRLYHDVWIRPGYRPTF